MEECRAKEGAAARNLAIGVAAALLFASVGLFLLISGAVQGPYAAYLLIALSAASVAVGVYSSSVLLTCSIAESKGHGMKAWHALVISVVMTPIFAIAYAGMLPDLNKRTVMTEPVKPEVRSKWLNPPPHV